MVNGYPLNNGDESKPRIHRACHLNRNSRCKTPSDIFIRLYVTLYIKHSNRVSIFVIRKLTSFLNSNTTCGFYTLTRAFEGKPRQGFFLKRVRLICKSYQVITPRVNLYQVKSITPFRGSLYK